MPPPPTISWIPLLLQGQHYTICQLFETKSKPSVKTRAFTNVFSTITILLPPFFWNLVANINLICFEIFFVSQVFVSQQVTDSLNIISTCRTEQKSQPQSLSQTSAFKTWPNLSFKIFNLTSALESWPKFSFKILKKLQLQICDQISASNSWPKISLKILTRLLLEFCD